jgi:RNA repair, ligase-Pnkp-associating, region of Hen1
VSDAELVRSGQDPLVASTIPSYRRFSMLLSISTTSTGARPATDLAGLLGQHPDAIRAATYPFGHAMVCFSQADEHRCTVAVMLQHPGQTGRPSMLADVLADVFGPAMTGEQDSGLLPFQVDIPLLPCTGGLQALWQLFVPIGYQVTTEPVVGGPPTELAVRITAETTLADLLTQLCLRLPVLDPTSDDYSRRARFAAITHQ